MSCEVKSCVFGRNKPIIKAFKLETIVSDQNTRLKSIIPLIPDEMLMYAIVLQIYLDKIYIYIYILEGLVVNLYIFSKFSVFRYTIQGTIYNEVSLVNVS